ncbi:P-loop containing nucleoside triphosphate hydrolase protein [Dactylonectria macrodidyma]|uniref:P-loop containing nucleoside triphosphate hydrolase protein n=1 Tax=Dactylonectria macrodidyma TaxID=307937 RepID=A0A9P9JGU9_9HYPO|nr:P-loop containing nucleoside triphosphate hydrolase protein [Dactylonectria macrodidyma]
MDDDPFSSLNATNIFENASSFSEFTQKIRPVKPEVGFQDAGLECELKNLDSIYNGKGERVLLRSGKKFHVERDREPAAYQSAIVRTQFWNRQGEEEYIELEIRSPHMKAALKDVIPEFKDFAIDLKHITIRNEPRCLFHFRNELFTFGVNLEPNSDAQKHLSFLLEYMQQELNAEIYSWTVMVEFELLFDSGNPSLEFPNLWMAFKPGDLIYIPAHRPTEPVAKVLEFDTMSRSCKCSKPWCVRYHRWSVRGYCVNYDGEKFGYDTAIAEIKYYEGYRALKELAVVPLQYHPDQHKIRAPHIARGKKFVDLQGRHHRRHTGTANALGKDRNSTLFGEEDFFPIQMTWINGRVVIDCKTFCEARPSHSIDLVTGKPLFKDKNCSSADFTDNQLIICHYEVAGFALNEKKWGFFHVDNLDEIQFDDNVFTSSLMLRPQIKKMILSLVKVHENEHVGFDDIISGKGKGMIFLLHGEPGVGKTLTAESVADHCKKPLLRIDASVLGTSAASVESSLAASFQLAERWKCVILLDEADVFLEQRSSSDLERNSLVAVFLRVLEYYEGILFLTTNRLESFDRAFKSRVHLAIHLPKLDVTSRRSIWETFLSMASDSDRHLLAENGALGEFSLVDLNGRQIKNVVRIAKARAESEGKPITKEFVDEALDAMRAFDEEMDGRSRKASDSDGGADDQGSAKRRRIGM